LTSGKPEAHNAASEFRLPLRDFDRLPLGDTLNRRIPPYPLDEMALALTGLFAGGGAKRCGPRAATASKIAKICAFAQKLTENKRVNPAFLCESHKIRCGRIPLRTPLGRVILDQKGK
jgi:hypothetical protein